jgi:hypothetical protein
MDPIIKTRSLHCEKSGFKSNRDAREIVPRRGSQKNRKFAHKIKDFSESVSSFGSGAIF